ncbi:phosphodiester glycosidase family protein [Microaerobacter geothermalis]|uniref:phosphodiester glycosidase family protein n=1 Tax=Microaerobacter geothermalis TaxID=674972 RepID=UPI001F42D7AD|nr:phosphodiester glycosidase family protein [Microaerobacter geothermalis]MCF6093700.1 phosphodiester glycosidase family protein [Microaerobacter geothermalis]
MVRRIIWYLNRFLFFLSAPVIGFLLALSLHPIPFHVEQNRLLVNTETFQSQLKELRNKTNSIVEKTSSIQLSLEELKSTFVSQQDLIQELIEKSKVQSGLADTIIEEQIIERLGPILDTYESDRVKIQLFAVIGKPYRGHVAKVKLKDPSAIRVVLAKDRWGETETTSEAARRMNAIFAVNGGGFYETIEQGEIKNKPIGTTIVDGKWLSGFFPRGDDVFFSGFSKGGSLIGGYFKSKEALAQLEPQSGVSFLPILIKDGKPLPIPKDWQNQRHPRTILGQFVNGDLFFMVIDGRQPRWSIGATLEEIQEKLMSWKVIDAYNLDGGGSSTLVFKGKLLNRPSDGQERPVTTNIVILP